MLDSFMGCRYVLNFYQSALENEVQAQIRNAPCQHSKDYFLNKSFVVVQVLIGAPSHVSLNYFPPLCDAYLCICSVMV